MVNAIKVASAFISALPPGSLSPETTGDYEGFVHPYVLQASVDKTSVKVIVRDFVTAGLKDKEALLTGIAERAAAQFPGARVEIAVEEQYRNMREILDRHPDVVERAREAIRRAGLEPHSKPIRGGTDGSRLSFMGLPTPNLFAGEHNFHSRLEWVAVQDMEKAVEVIVQLAAVWAERSSAAPRCHR
jgi:tripeptide aminopeptidase